MNVAGADAELHLPPRAAQLDPPVAVTINVAFEDGGIHLAAAHPAIAGNDVIRVAFNPPPRFVL